MTAVEPQAEVVPRPRRRSTWIAAAVAIPLILLLFALTKGFVATQAAATQSPLAGKPAPVIDATDIDGRPVSTEAGRGRWVAVGERRTTCLSLEDEDLVAEGQDLGITPIAPGQQQSESGDHETDDEWQRLEHDDGPYPAGSRR